MIFKIKYFDDRLKKLNKKLNSNKTKHIEVKTKLNDLEKKVEVISTKGLTADLINKHSILNVGKYFFSDGLQNYLAFISGRRVYWISKDGSNSKIELWVWNVTKKY